MTRPSRTLVALILFFADAACSNAQVCAPPPGIQDVVPPPIMPTDRMVSHSEEVVIDRPLDVVQKEVDAGARRLEQHIRKADSLPGVLGTYELDGPFGAPGTRRVVCLTDGSTAVDRVLEHVRDKDSSRFRYQVYGYTSDKAKPVEYAIGYFLRTDLGDGRTRVIWTYSFKLNRERFPGRLGCVGDYIFKIGFLDRDYAQMMKRTLDAQK